MKPGDLVSIKGRYGVSLGSRTYLILAMNDWFVRLDGFSMGQVFRAENLEVISEAR